MNLLAEFLSSLVISYSYREQAPPSVAHLDDFGTHAMAFDIDFVHVTLEIEIQEFKDQEEFGIQMNDVEQAV